ncbi:MAG: PDZ domain-containing protein, partial [Bacteroidota bacterium]|nr:PDZ domain-containing protein [Bacteroidota bacterium]
YIGVSISTVDETIAKANGLDKAEGVFVQDVVGEAAKAAGVKAGDIILTIDGKSLKAPNELQTYIAAKHPGDKVKLLIWRDEKKIEKVITLKPRNNPSDVASNDASDDESDSGGEEVASKSISFDNLGFSVAKADKRMMKEREVTSGVVVSDIKSFGEASSRGLSVNDIILDADHKEITSVSDFEKIVKSKKPGDALMLRVKGAQGGTRFVAVMIPKQ